MTYNFSEFKKSTEAILEWLRGEYSGIRAGRAAPSILDSVSVIAYGSKVPVNQVATVNVEGPKTLRITPWDRSVSGAIDSAIRESNLGLSVSVDDAGLRVSFPELSSERRVQLQKLAKEKMEEARIRLRSEREKTLADIEKQESAGAISEDEKFRYKTDLQKLVDEANSKFEEALERKQKEIEE